MPIGIIVTNLRYSLHTIFRIIIIKCSKQLVWAGSRAVGTACLLNCSVMAEALDLDGYSSTTELVRVHIAQVLTDESFINETLRANMA